MATDANAQLTYNATAQTPNVPFTFFLIGLTVWSLLKFAAESFVARVNPQFFEDLKMNARRGYDLYFGTWLGSIFKIVSIAACTTSLFTTSAETDIVGLVRPLNTAEKWCWGCRAVIYTQEIPHIASHPELVIHHILSIGAMLAILAFNIPRRQLYIAWAGLFSEFVSNARRLFKMHAKLSQRLNWWLTVANVVLILLLRVTGCFVALIWVLQSGIRGVSLIIDVGCWAIYLIYMIHVSISEAIRCKLVTFDMTSPARIIIAETFHINLSGVILGLSFVATELSAIFIYGFTGPRLSTMAELHSVAWVALQAVIAGMVGGYVAPPILQFISFPFSDNAADRERCRMQGGFLFAALVLALSPTLGDSTLDRLSLFSCMAISWPLLNTLSYAGQYFDAPWSETEHSHPLQLIASLQLGISYLSLLIAVLSGMMPNLFLAAVFSTSLQIIVGRVISPRRPDATSSTKGELSLARLWTVAQHAWCVFLLSYVATFETENVATLGKEYANNSFDPDLYVTIFWGFFVKDYKTPIKWAAFIGVYHGIFELMVSSWLVKPAPSAKPPQGKKRKADKKKGKDKEEDKEVVVEATDTTTTTETGKGVLSRINLKVLASLAGVVLASLLAFGLYAGIMPEAFSDVESGSRGERKLGGERLQFFLEAVSDWQVLGSLVGVAVFPGVVPVVLQVVHVVLQVVRLVLQVMS